MKAIPVPFGGELTEAKGKFLKGILCHGQLEERFLAKWSHMLAARVFFHFTSVNTDVLIFGHISKL